MKTNETNTKIENKILLSVLWTYLSVNYILCDVLSNMETAVLQQLLNGQVTGIHVTEEFLLFAAISLEIPFIMIVLSRVLPFKINKISNLVASPLMIVYQVGSFFVGTASLHYIFFSAIEIAANGIIFLIALQWVNQYDKTNESR